jgi:hypothetical protein
MTEVAEQTVVAENAPVVNMEVIMEGWGAKQGTKYPNWNMRWFVLEKKPTAPDSDDIADTRVYFKNSSDSYERAHNYNTQTDKTNLVLSYYVDDSKKELKERFEFDENTFWGVRKPRVTIGKFRGGPIDAIHLFCKGSRGAKKLIFVPFWGFCEPTFNLLCQPWVICMEHARKNAYDGEHDTYYSDLAKVDEDTFGRTTKDLMAKLDQFKACFDDEITFKDYKANVIMGLKLFVPIRLFGKNAQDDDLNADKELVNSYTNNQNEWQMKFNKKMKELNKQKEVAGSREAWIKLCAQAKWRNLKFDEWMAIKDQDDNIANLPANLR